MRRKLNSGAVQKIRDLYRTGHYKQAYLASLFGVTPTQISRIVNGKRRNKE